MYEDVTQESSIRLPFFCFCCFSIRIRIRTLISWFVFLTLFVYQSNAKPSHSLVTLSFCNHLLLLLLLCGNSLLSRKKRGAVCLCKTLHLHSSAPIITSCGEREERIIGPFDFVFPPPDIHMSHVTLVSANYFLSPPKPLLISSPSETRNTKIYQTTWTRHESH